MPPLEAEVTIIKLLSDQKQSKVSFDAVKIGKKVMPAQNIPKILIKLSKLIALALRQQRVASAGINIQTTHKQSQDAKTLQLRQSNVPQAQLIAKPQNQATTAGCNKTIIGKKSAGASIWQIGRQHFYALGEDQPKGHGGG